MPSLLTYGAAALATGLLGWWWFGKPAAYVPPGVKPGTPISGVFVDRETAHDDWTTGALDGASAGYDVGKTGIVKSENFHPDTHALVQPPGVAAFAAYTEGYQCGARKGFALGQRMRQFFGEVAAMGSTFDSTSVDSRAVIGAACDAAFAAWWTKHGAESVGGSPSVAGVAGRVARIRVARIHRPHLAPILGTTHLVTLAPPRRV